MPAFTALADDPLIAGNRTKRLRDLLIAKRQAELSKAVTDIAWGAQVRLCERYRRLAARRVPTNKIVVAIARELTGFIWDIARNVTPQPAPPQQH